MVTAYARVALGAAAEGVVAHRRDLDDFEHVTLSADGATWDAAQAAVEAKLPADAMLLSWSTWG